MSRRPGRMGKPSTQDMERWSLELSLYLRKEFKRFSLANRMDRFEQVLLDSLPNEPVGDNQENVLKLEKLSSREDERRLSGFLKRLVDKCSDPGDHELMQRTLRTSLLLSRRQSVLREQPHAHSNLTIKEPICYFCATDLPIVTDHSSNLNNNNHVSTPVQPETELNNFQYQIDFIKETPPHSNYQPSPELVISTTPPHESLAEEAQPGAGGEHAHTTNASNAAADRATAGEPASNDQEPRAKRARVSATDDDQLACARAESELHTTVVANLEPETAAAATNELEPEPENLNHEDSMQQWFENMNSKLAPLPRASTPLSDLAADEKKNEKTKTARKPMASPSASSTFQAYFSKPMPLQVVGALQSRQLSDFYAEPHTTSVSTSISCSSTQQASRSYSRAQESARMSASQQPASTSQKIRTKRTTKKRTTYNNSKQFSKQ